MIPRFIKKAVSKNPALANYLKERYDRFMESPDSANAVGKKRFAVLKEIQKTTKVSVAENIVVDIEGAQFLIQPSPSGTIGLLADSLYESEETEFVKQRIKPTDTVLDIGANFGWYTIFFSKWATKVFAFEPIPSTYEEVRDNVALNQCGNVEVVNKALGDKDGVVDFFLPKTFGGSGGASEHNYFGEKVTIHMTTLDEYAEKHDVRPNFIKADIEGGEFAMLRGGIKTITRFHPDLFLEIEERHTERFGYKPQDIISLLEKIGYRYTKIGPIMFYFHHEKN